MEKLLPDLGVRESDGTLVLPPDDGGWSTEMLPLEPLVPDCAEDDPVLPAGGVWPVGVLRPSEGPMNVGRSDPDEEPDRPDGVGFTVEPLLFDPLGSGTLTLPVWPARGEEGLFKPDPDGPGVTGVCLPNKGREIGV